MKFKLKYLALTPVILAFLVATIATIILAVFPVKYLLLLIFAEILTIALIAVLLSRQHLAAKIIAGLLIAASTLVASAASYYLIVVNASISNFAAHSVVTTEETGDADITNTPFVFVINGVDGKNPEDLTSKNAQTDVNQIVAVNPNTHQILLLNTPRDYYVYLHGHPEKPDKLNHAGYYSVDMSRQTLEDLYDINIDYYVRINFETLVGLVDLIGGIDIESEWEFNTSSHTHVKKGWNHFNGKQALAYARERKYFGTGDIQRAADQQQVMVAIFNKMTHSPEILTNFPAILNSLQDSFQTDFDIAQVKNFVQFQLDTNPNWQIETMAVTGEAILTSEVYSLPSTGKYYVVIPDEASVQNASKKLRYVL